MIPLVLGSLFSKPIIRPLIQRVGIVTFSTHQYHLGRIMYCRASHSRQ